MATTPEGATGGGMVVPEGVGREGGRGSLF